MCHHNQQCVNTVGTYRCQVRCGPGLKPSATGTSCEGEYRLSVRPRVLNICRKKPDSRMGSFRRGRVPGVGRVSVSAPVCQHPQLLPLSLSPWIPAVRTPLPRYVHLTGDTGRGGCSFGVRGRCPCVPGPHAVNGP